MAFYIVSILGADVLIILLNLFVGLKQFDYSILYIVLGTILGTIGVIALDGLFAFIIRRFPEKKFSYKQQFFSVSKKEYTFYEKIGIKKWKDSIIELGMFTNFSKSKISDPHSIEYIERFILECNYGSVIHVQNAIFGFLMICFFPIKYLWFFGMPIAIVNALLSMAPFAILRYNVSRLLRMHALLEKKAERKND